MQPLLIILDLDETLIHASETPLDRQADFMVGNHYHVYRRPGLSSFLDYCLARFPTAIWTSASACYAEAVVREILADSSGLEFVWARERCTMHHDHEQGRRHWIKPLKKVQRLGYDLARVLVIDDSPEKMIRNYGNHIRVTPFVGDLADRELTRLAAYLETLRDAPNVRKLEKRVWTGQAG